MSKRKPKTPVKKSFINPLSVVFPQDALTLNLRTDLRGKLDTRTTHVRAEILIPRRNGGYDKYTQAFQVK